MRIEIEQNTEEWLELRASKITASNFGCLMAHEGKAFGEPAHRYAMKKALYRKGVRGIEGYTNFNMERGIELEPIARQLYEMEKFVIVKNGGFYVKDEFGASPDGIVGKGGIEIKCVIYSTHFKVIKSQSYDLSYKWQIQGEIWLGDLDWIDFISYCPEFIEDKRLYIFRVNEDYDMIERLQKRLNEFLGLVKFYEDLLG